MTQRRLGYVAAAISLLVVPLAGCDTASDRLSTADACADLVEMSLSELRDVQEQLPNPERVAQSFRDAAERFKDKASEVDDADVKKAVDKYTAEMKRLAQKAESGETPDLNAMVRANSDLAEACS